MPPKQAREGAPVVTQCTPARAAAKLGRFGVKPKGAGACCPSVSATRRSTRSCPPTPSALAHRLCEAGLQRLELLVAHALLDLSYKLLDASAVEFSLSTAAS